MAYEIKYSTGSVDNTIKKGNLALAVNDVNYGPTSVTDFYAGLNAPPGGYVVYHTNGSTIYAYVAANETELINITRELSGGTYTSVDECINYYFTQDNMLIISSDNSLGNIASDGLVLDLNVNNLPTNVQNLNNPSSKLRNWYDNTGRLTYPVSGAVNIGLPLTSWATIRSNIALITDGSVLPPNSGSAVWSSTVNTASYVNTLHRMWALGDQHGVIGSLGQGYYRYYMWVKGAPHNSPTASIQIDISDGSGGYANSGAQVIGTGSAWQLISAWDLGGSYNAAKFFDYFLSGCTSGDTYYISGITVARYNVPDSGSLVPLISFPGYIDYYSTSSVSQQGYLFNSITSNSQSLVFDGADDYIQTSKTDFTANNDFTYELVVKSDQYLTGKGILANKGYWSLTQGAAIGNISNPQTIYGYVTTNTGHYDISSNVGPTYGWTHVIMRRSNNDLRFFINGNHQGGTRTISGTVTDDSNEFYLGSYNDGSGTSWKGNMALARVYSRALSDAEILQNFAASGYPRLVEDVAGTTDPDFSRYTGRVVNTLTSQDLYSSSSLVLTAAGCGTGSLYALKPVMTGVTSSRASTSTRLTNGGNLLEIATNVPNISYPYTNNQPYYLIEPQSTNLLTYSNNPFNNSNNWGNRQIENVTATLYDTIGDINILKLTEGTNNGQHRVGSGNNYTGGNYTGTKIWTSSFYAKPNGRSRMVIYVDGQIGGYIDLEAGTTTLQTAGYFKKSKVTKLANGYCYVEITFSKTNATSGSGPYYIEWLVDDNNNTSYQGDGTSGILMYGYQIEEMQFGTSYIKTNAGSTVTRTASSRGTHLTGLQSKGILSSTGTVYIEGFYKGTSYYYQYVFGQTGVGGANGVSISTNQTTPSSTYSFSMRIYKSSSFVGDITLDSSYYDGKPFKMCFKYDGTNCHFFYNGVYKGYLQFSGASIDSFFTGTENTSNNTIGNGSCLGISSMSMFPTALSDDQCLTLTR